MYRTTPWPSMRYDVGILGGCNRSGTLPRGSCATVRVHFGLALRKRFSVRSLSSSIRDRHDILDALVLEARGHFVEQGQLLPCTVRTRDAQDVEP